MNSEMVRWFTERFREWEKKKGSRQTISAFGEFLEVSQPTISAYMRGARKPSQAGAKLITEKLENYELLSILGYAGGAPEILADAFPNMPVHIRERLEAALSEIEDKSTDLNENDPRIDEIIKNALKQNGFKL